MCYEGPGGHCLGHFCIDLLLRFRDVKVNRMKEGHSILEASLSRFNTVFTAECDVGDGLQTEEHIIWDCKLYENQGATTIDILSENSKKDYPK
jgi:hypothetical protein